MTHNLFGERFFARQKPAWHGIGEVFPKDMQITLKEAIARVVDFEIIEMPTYFQLPDGSYQKIPGRTTLVRTPTVDDPVYRPLEVVSDHYQKVDNFILGDIFEDVSRIWKVETVGVLKDGQILFATLDAGMIEIKGDVIHQFFLLSDSKDRRTATTAAYTPVRVVCQNTLTSGLSEATLRMNVPHRGDAYGNLKKIAVSIARLQQMADETNRLFGYLAESPVSLDDFKRLLKEQIYPEPTLNDNVIEVTDEFYRLVEKSRQHQEAALELYQKFNDEHPSIANTKWAAWNVVVELEDWKEGRGNKSNVAAIFGQRRAVKEKALSVILNN